MANNGHVPTTLAAAAERLANGTVSSRSLVEACLARIADASGQGGHAFVQVYADQARSAADAMDLLRKAARAPGPYAGIPVSLKDLFDVAGEVTRAGSRVLGGAAPAGRHAVVVQRLLSAGLVLIGRTNMTEFAFSGVGINPHYGTPSSPWDRATGRIPGGSSSGAAVSVSDGFALAAIGTDTGGSCRIPAALCGITGFKPTARRVSLDGALPLSPSQDSIGPLANSVACCAALDGVMAGTHPGGLDTVHISGMRFVLPINFAFEHLDSETEASLDRAVARLDKAGALIYRCNLPVFDAITAAHARGGFAATQAFAWHQALLAAKGDEYDPRVASRIRPGGDMSAVDYFELAQARNRIISQFESEMAQYDALIMPTVPIKPPALAEFASDEAYRRLNYLLLRNPSTINFVDGCAISLPCHASRAPPAGLMLAAPGMHDKKLLTVAGAVEEILGA